MSLIPIVPAATSSAYRLDLAALETSIANGNGDRGLTFSTDGTIFLWHLQSGSAGVQVYDATPWDLDTIAYDALIAISTTPRSGSGLVFNPDGDEVTYCSSGSNITTDVLTVAYGGTVSSSKTTATPAGDACAIAITDGGTKLFALDQADRILYRATLSTPYDITTRGTYAAQLNLSGAYGSQTDSFTIANDGKKLVIANDDTLYEYSLTTPFDASTATATGVTLTPSADRIFGVIYGKQGRKTYAMTGNNIYQYATEV